MLRAWLLETTVPMGFLNTTGALHGWMISAHGIKVRYPVGNIALLKLKDRFDVSRSFV